MTILFTEQERENIVRTKSGLKIKEGCPAKIARSIQAKLDELQAWSQECRRALLSEVKHRG